MIHPFIAKIRITLNKIGIAVGAFFYKITCGLFPSSMFLMSVKPSRLKTDVKIIQEDDDSITIAKVDEFGIIKSEDFKIISTTDLHLGDNPKLRKKAFQMLSNHIGEIHPDLVVFTGDIILSKFQQVDAIQFAKLMEKFGIYWTIVYGNHEAREDKGFFKRLLLEGISGYPHCLCKAGNEELFGYANHCINILNGENSLQQALFFFDSGRDILDKYRDEHKVPHNLNGYDFLKYNQINWYKDKINSLEEKYGEFKSMMFMHIPLPEYAECIMGSKDIGFSFTDKCEVLYGSAFESIGCSPFNSGMFDAILEMRSTQAVFCGHDHVNDFCVKYKGIFLVYNQACGYETYKIDEINGSTEDKWQLGVTVIKINKDGTFSLMQRFNSRYLKEVIQRKQEEKNKNKKRR